MIKTTRLPVKIPFKNDQLIAESQLIFLKINLFANFRLQFFIA